MKRFNISQGTCTIGFQTHTTINLERPIAEQLHRRTLYFRHGLDKGNAPELQKIIEWNSSLRVGFGWSFESTEVYKTIMSACEDAIIPPFIGDIVELTSDSRCDWLGFVPFNTFDKEYYADLCLEDLVTFNNSLINYQTRIVEFLTSHPIYRAHAIVRDHQYRFDYFRKIRKDPVALSSAFQYYIDSVTLSSGVDILPRDIVEDMIGCHYLEHPHVFFELLNFNKLKGLIYE